LHSYIVMFFKIILILNIVQSLVNLKMK